MDNNVLNMQNIKKCMKQKKIYWTKHCLNRLNQRNILFEDVKIAIDNGKIIEYYYEDYPYPSCLILGNDKNKKALHIVCGIGNDILYMITAYHPNMIQWEKNMKTRRDL